MFCPKCGSILVPKKEGSKKVMACSCGFRSDKIEMKKIQEKVRNGGRDIEVIDKGELETLPLVKVDCPECGNKEARFWTVQTRAADEPETRFNKCTKCGHTWREYD